MCLIAMPLRISRAKFHCIDLQLYEIFKITQVSFWHALHILVHVAIIHRVPEKKGPIVFWP